MPRGLAASEEVGSWVDHAVPGRGGEGVRGCTKVDSTGGWFPPFL